MFSFFVLDLCSLLCKFIEQKQSLSVCFWQQAEQLLRLETDTQGEGLVEVIEEEIKKEPQERHAFYTDVI